MVYRTAVAAPIFGLRREIDRLFEDAFGREGGGSAWTPVVDVREDAKEISFELELPGIAPEHVEVSSENGVLTIHGEKQNVRREGDEESRYHMVERSYGTFVRSFRLPQGMDEEKIEAEFENGVLRVRVPKAERAQPKRIQIRNTGSQQAVGSGPSTRANRAPNAERAAENESKQQTSGATR